MRTSGVEHGLLDGGVHRQFTDDTLDDIPAAPCWATLLAQLLELGEEALDGAMVVLQHLQCRGRRVSGGRGEGRDDCFDGDFDGDFVADLAADVTDVAARVAVFATGDFLVAAVALRADAVEVGAVGMPEMYPARRKSNPAQGCSTASMADTNCCSVNGFGTSSTSRSRVMRAARSVPA